MWLPRGWRFGHINEVVEKWGGDNKIGNMSILFTLFTFLSRCKVPAQSRK